MGFAANLEPCHRDDDAANACGGRVRMMKRRLDTHLALVFGVTVTLALVGIISFVNNRAAAVLEGATSTMFAQMTHQSRASIDDSFTNLNLMTAMFAADPQVLNRSPENERALVRQFSLIMQAKPFTSAMYVGYDDGEFILLRQLTSPVARRNLAAPDTARYLLQTIRNTAQGRETRLVFLDAALNAVGELDRPDFFYDPRNRRWYYDAFASDGAVLTDPYRFFATAESGVTIARRIASNRGVMGIDLSLADLSAALRRMKSTPSSELIITDPDGAVIAASNPAAELPTAYQNSPSRGPVANVASTVVPTMLTAVRSHDGSDRTTVISDHGRAWTMHVAPLRSGQWTFAMAVAMPQDEIMAGVRHRHHARLDQPRPDRRGDPGYPLHRDGGEPSADGDRRRSGRHPDLQFPGTAGQYPLLGDRDRYAVARDPECAPHDPALHRDRPRPLRRARPRPAHPPPAHRNHQHHLVGDRLHLSDRGQWRNLPDAARPLRAPRAGRRGGGGRSGG
ncbi:cache domain-containing protein, partial [Ancylobacter sp. G4_0304]